MGHIERKMNVRLKLANKEQKMCSNKTSEESSDQERREEEVEAEDKVPDAESDDDTTTTEASGNINVEANVDQDKNESTPEFKDEVSESIPEKKEGKQTCQISPDKHTDADEHTEHSESRDHAEHSESKDADDKLIKTAKKSVSSELSKSQENKREQIKDQGDSLNSSDESDNEKSNISSKLDAEALSASLSSSKCILKRNRDDLDSGDDSGGEKEEPDSKKSHVGEVTPKLVSKLKSSELLASMSSSKSLLKRGIEKVDTANKDEKTDAPESKKSNLAQTPKPEESHEKFQELSKVTPRKEIETPEKTKPLKQNPVLPKVLKFPESPCQIAQEKGNLLMGPSVKEPEKPKHEEPSKEEVRQKIGAKDLAGQRQLERKRLNKMLAIFDDQKIVKKFVTCGKASDHHFVLI